MDMDLLERFGSWLFNVGIRKKKEVLDLDDCLYDGEYLNGEGLEITVYGARTSIVNGPTNIDLSKKFTVLYVSGAQTITTYYATSMRLIIGGEKLAWISRDSGNNVIGHR